MKRLIVALGLALCASPAIAQDRTLIECRRVDVMDGNLLSCYGVWQVGGGKHPQAWLIRLSGRAAPALDQPGGREARDALRRVTGYGREIVCRIEDQTYTSPTVPMAATCTDISGREPVNLIEALRLDGLVIR